MVDLSGSDYGRLVIASRDVKDLQRALDESGPYERGSVRVTGFDASDDVDGIGDNVIRVVVHILPPERGETWRSKDLDALSVYLDGKAQELGLERRVMKTLDVVEADG